jgi:hypothetical protein
MTIILHPPGDVSFSGDEVPGEEQARIARALQAAVQRAIDKAVRDADVRVRPARSPGGELSQPFDPARADPASGSYQVPSYRDAGKLTGVQLLKGAPGNEVTDGPSPLQDALVMVLTGNNYIFIRSSRYAAAATLTEAYALGLAVFGTTSFTIAQGPLGSPRFRYWAIGTDPGVTDADLGRQAAGQAEQNLPPELADRGTQVRAGEELLLQVTGSDGGAYLIRGLVTTDRVVHWRGAVSAALWYAQLEAEQRAGVSGPPTAQFRHLVFAEVDRLVAQFEGGDDTVLQRAAELLSRMDRVAFSLVDWETKVGYLKVLLAAWTWQAEESAIVQIFASLDNGKEADAMVDLLRQAGRYDQLFDDLDDELYTLLTTVGERFPRERGPLTLDGLVELLQSMGLLPKTLQEALLGWATAGPATTEVPDALWDQAHDAVMGVIHLSADLLESLGKLVTEPGKVITGLVQLVLKVSLASIGYPPAVQEITQLLGALTEQVLTGMRGADRLGCGEKIVRRVKWRLVWEIASVFVGVGEVKAAIQGAGVAEKLAGVLRFLGILAALGEEVDAEAQGARLARLAALLKAERGTFASADEAAELLSRLPARDVKRLGQLLTILDIREGETLAELTVRSQAIGLGSTLEDVIGQAELLKAMAGKAGGLTEEITAAFQALTGDDGLELADAQRVVAAIGEGQGARFAAALRRIPVGRLPAGARAAFLEVVAASPRRMDAVLELGIDTFAAVHRRADGHAGTIDEYLTALQKIDGRLAAQGNAAEYRRLLDRLTADDPAAWLELETARRAESGQRVIANWVQQLRGEPRAQAALDRLLRRNADSLVDSLIDQLAADKGLISDPETVMALNEIAGISEGELDGMLELQRYIDRSGPYGGYPQWDEILFTETARRRNLLELIAGLRDPANPANLVVQSGMEDVVNATLRHGADIQGGLGHLEAARSLLRDFPGARFRFEVTRVAGGVRRDVDIVVELEVAGREVDVEVKSYQATTGLDHVRGQISKDLLRHLGDAGGPWSDLLWRFPDPAFASQFPVVERLFEAELTKLHAAGQLTMPLADALAALRSRFAAAPPWRLLDVLH